jgi:bifunctional non-homologous end joining protein LigD
MKRSIIQFINIEPIGYVMIYQPESRGRPTLQTMKNKKHPIEIDGKVILISNPNKLLWPEYEIRKIDLVQYLLEISPLMLPYLQNRLLTTIRYPDGVDGKSFYQKNKPTHAPVWIPDYRFEKTNYMIANDRATLIYLGNQACLEYHTSFHCVPGEEPTELVFDLDPSVDDFSMVIETALRIKEELDQLHLQACVKTSGASGLQIYIPLQHGHTFEETRRFGAFFATYMSQKYPKLITIERMVKNRGRLVYFDYLQHWRGKTLIATYSPRAKKIPCVSAPISWTEVPSASPSNYTILNILTRINEKGDLFQPLLSTQRYDLKPLLKMMKGKK